MSIDRLVDPALVHDRGPRAAVSAAAEIVEEAQHDALQAVGTILALLEASALTLDDPRASATRLAQIRDEVLCLRSVVRDALVSSVDRREPASAREVVDVADETARIMSAATVGWSGAVGVVADTSVRAVVGAPVLRRIVRNVVRNAVRAAGSQGQVRVSVTPCAAEVQIEVEDDGPGFGALPVQHGIGLRSVRRLVQHAGGRVETSTPSRLGGASVRIHLPAVPRGAAS